MKKERSCTLENNFHVELLRPHKEKAKRKKKYKTKKEKEEEVKGRKRHSDKPKIKTKRIIDHGILLNAHHHHQVQNPKSRTKSMALVYLGQY